MSVKGVWTNYAQNMWDVMTRLNDEVLIAKCNKIGGINNAPYIMYVPSVFLFKFS